jgi:hypothetical protein
MPLAYTSYHKVNFSGENTCFTNTNWITLQSSSEDQVSNVICSMLPLVKVLPPTKKILWFLNIKVAGWETIILEQDS